MSFSVLLSLYHKESALFLRQSLDSLFTQTLQSDEVVLVLDGLLTRDLNEVVAQYADKYSALKVVSLPQNVGLGKALNEGLKHCSYELVARMDTDDIAKSDRFEKQLKVFQMHPEYDVVGSWIEEFEEDPTHIVSIRKLPQNHVDILYFAKKRNPINHPVVMFRKSAVLAAGGYQHFPLLEDYYLWIRMLMNGAKFYNIQESLLYFRTSADMFKRRGGWKYAINEFRFQKLLYQKGFIGVKRFCLNVAIRFVARIIPNSWRGMVYGKLLRR